MAQLTNEQWSAMTQEDRDKFLRGLVTYNGKTVTGRFPAQPDPQTLDFTVQSRPLTNEEVEATLRRVMNEPPVDKSPLVDVDYASIERRIMAQHFTKGTDNED